MKKKINNAALVVPNKIIKNRTIEIEQGVITAIYPSSSEKNDAPGLDVIDASGLIVTPGMIDIHIHGCAGADTMDASLEALSAISSHLPRHGVTSFYATTVTNSRANLQTAMDAIAAYQEQLPGARLLGRACGRPLYQYRIQGRPEPGVFPRTGSG